MSSYYYRQSTPNLCDSYKIGHRAMYPKGMTKLQSNWTARGTRIPGVRKVVFFGLQAFLQKYMVDHFNREFFDFDEDTVIESHERRVKGLLGVDVNMDHWRALHQLGYVPLRFSALPEGTEVPLRVPCFLVENTHDDFAWLVNYFESLMSSEIWLPITSATAALRFRRLLDMWAAHTSSVPEFVDWQGHDFAFRGMAGVDAASASGAAHLLSFAGSDCLAAMDWTERYYGKPATSNALRYGEPSFVGGSVPASEHSVMCAGGEIGELETFERILAEFPKGVVSVVSDTWDLWGVLVNTLPDLKEKIMARDGKLVIRPDSGDPVDILCGEPDRHSLGMDAAPWRKGVIELLWDVFGGTVNARGFKELDPHIGAIYGDAITYDRAMQICQRLSAKGFASTNMVLGIGSFTYQYVTRDTFGMAMKSTWCEVDGKGRDLFKTPVTDDGTKHSARGRLACFRDNEGELTLIQRATPEEEAKSLYRPVWENGEFLQWSTFREIAERVGVRKLLPA